MNKIFLILIILNSSIVLAQQKLDETGDVKVGLVLSGGGAKGFAHVGVLKILEEAGIRIDYIAGTSMGSIVGGLYASGYTANELDSILKVHDFTTLIRDEIPRKSTSFYQKENAGKYAISLPIKNRKIGLPTAVSKGQNIFNILSQLTEHIHSVNDFSQLPIPFFCIATDLETGEEVVLDHGYLPEAVRASGSFPGLLSPVRINNRILVDGGLVNNFPVDELKAKGVDVIIGIDVQGKLLKRKELTSLSLILMQIAGFQVYKNIDKKAKKTNVYIKPDVSKFNNFSFDKVDELILVGEEAARNQINELKEIAKMQHSVSKRNTRVNTDDLKKDIVIKEIEFNGNYNYTDKYCLRKLNFESGETVSQKDFFEGVNALTATGNFQSIHYRFIPVKGGTKIEFELLENNISTFLKFGAHYDDLYKTAVLVNLTKKHALFKNDFLSADFIIGDNLRYNIDYILDNGFNWSIGINTRYNSFKKNIVSSTLPIPLSEDPIPKTPTVYNDFTTQIYVQTTLNNNIALRLGIEDKYLKIYRDELVEDKDERTFFDNTNYINLFGRATFDSYSSDNFPKTGFYLDAVYRVYLMATETDTNDFSSFSQLSGELGFAQTFFDKLTFQYIAQAGITIGSNGNPIHDFHLGGNNENFVNTFVSFYGYDVADLNESSYLKSTFIFRYEIFKENYLSFIANYGRITNDIWNDGSVFQDTKSGYAVGYSMKSLIGPLEIKFSWTPDNERKFWYINVGFWF